MERARSSGSLMIAGREVPDPFELKLSWTQLTVEEKDRLLSSLDSHHPGLIEGSFKGRPEATVIVLCKGEVIGAYGDFISAEEIRRLEREHGAICIPIVNQRRFIIEESAWSDLTTMRRGDYYPTLPIVLGDEPWSEKLFTILKNRFI